MLNSQVLVVVEGQGLMTPPHTHWGAVAAWRGHLFLNKIGQEPAVQIVVGVGVVEPLLLKIDGAANLGGFHLFTVFVQDINLDLEIYFASMK